MAHQWKTGDRCAPVDGSWAGTVIDLRPGKLIVKDDDGFVDAYPMEDMVPLGPLDVNKPVSKDVEQKAKPKQKGDIPTLDLHAERLPGCRKLPVDMILACQLDELNLFLHRMKHIRSRRLGIVHGKGKGVLRANVISVLRKNGFRHFSDETLDGGSLLVERY